MLAMCCVWVKYIDLVSLVAACQHVGGSGWAKKVTDPKYQGYIKGTHLLYARCVVASASFHAAMDSVFEGCSSGGGCTVVHAPMKPFARAEAKVKDASSTGYGSFLPAIPVFEAASTCNLYEEAWP